MAKHTFPAVTFYWPAGLSPLRATQALVFLLMAISLAGCATRPVTGALAVTEVPAPKAKNHDILIVTTRAKDDSPGTYFGTQRSDEPNYAEAVLSVPPDHKPGTIEWPQAFPGDPEKSFAARKATYLDGDAAMRARLNHRLSQQPAGKRSVFLFIHGYNTLFAESLYRFTQVVNDSGFTGVPMLFTWASRGSFSDYLYDLNSALIARAALKKTLLELSRSKADQIVILAHSMGNQLLMETLLQLTPGERKTLQRKLSFVALAAPDIDVDLFKAQLKQIGNADKPFLLLVSEDDRALKLSSLLAGGKSRVGAYTNKQELADLGAIVVDLTEVDGPSSFNHDKFANVGEFGPQIRQVLAQQNLRDFDPNPPSGFEQAGRSLTGFVSATAQVVITMPATLVTGGLQTVSTR